MKAKDLIDFLKDFPEAEVVIDVTGGLVPETCELSALSFQGGKVIICAEPS